MNSTNATAPLRAALDKVTGIKTEITLLSKRAESSAALQFQLENEADLSDANAIAQIGQLQTITALIPRRISYQEEVLTAAESELLKECHQFISQHLSPRIGKIIRDVEARTRTSLQDHFREDELVRAVQDSIAVREVKSLGWNATITSTPQNGVIVYAEQLLEKWADCGDREAKLS